MPAPAPTLDSAGLLARTLDASFHETFPYRRVRGSRPCERPRRSRLMPCSYPKYSSSRARCDVYTPPHASERPGAARGRRGLSSPRKSRTIDAGSPPTGTNYADIMRRHVDCRPPLVSQQSVISPCSSMNDQERLRRRMVPDRFWNSAGPLITGAGPFSISLRKAPADAAEQLRPRSAVSARFQEFRQSASSQAGGELTGLLPRPVSNQI